MRTPHPPILSIPGFYVDDNNVCFPNDKLLEFGVEMKARAAAHPLLGRRDLPAELQARARPSPTHPPTPPPQLSLLNEASTLLAGLAARAARSRSPSAAATARRAGALAASLQGLYTKYGCSAGFCGPSAPAGWFAPRPEDRAVLEASADEMAALMVEPGTRALMADEPGLVPEALRGPGDGATRADMCAKVRDMEVSAEVRVGPWSSGGPASAGQLAGASAGLVGAVPGTVAQPPPARVGPEGRRGWAGAGP